MCAQEEGCFGVSIAHYRVRHEPEAGDYCLLIQKHCIGIFVLWKHCHSNRQVCTSFARLRCVNIVLSPRRSAAQGASVYRKTCLFPVQEFGEVNEL